MRDDERVWLSANRFRPNTNEHSAGSFVDYNQAVQADMAPWLVGSKLWCLTVQLHPGDACAALWVMVGT